MRTAGMSSDAFADYVVGHGELWSAKLLTLCCRQLGADVAFMDTREVLVVTPTTDGTSVDLNEDVSNGKVCVGGAREACWGGQGAHEVLVTRY